MLKAIDVFRRIESLPFSRESSELFDRPSVNLGRIHGGDALNKVPDLCTMVVDIRYLPNQDPGDILEQIRSIPDIEVVKTFTRGPADVSRSNPYVIALVAAVGRLTSGESMSVGRDGASDAISFLQAGIPAVEFGPAGAGHHGPEEWVSIASLARYRQALCDFVAQLPARARAARRAARRRGRARVSDDEAPPRRGRGLVWRGLLAGFLITLMTAGAVSAAGLLQVEDILDTLRAQGRAAIEIPEIDRADAGKAQTLMILGSDRRYGDREAGIPPRSDTIILVRLDPDKEVIAMTSIPRDLLVEVPGVGSSVKINTAYENFGERGTVRTVKKLLSIDGEPFPINHVITIDFGGFRKAIDYIGCVYVDIDRDYFNDQGGPGGYAVIDIDPGYQKLCGKDALAYVRYRHGDNDLVRAARQQDFLRQVRSAKGTKQADARTGSRRAT